MQRNALISAPALALAAALAAAPMAAQGGTPAPATGLVLELPVVCDMDRVCSIQKYMDHDPSPERMDWSCGRLSLDGDNGTDFRVPDYPKMEDGIAVVAAAPGVVKGMRDGMDDVSVHVVGKDAIKGREAGNGVVVDHGGGWETQYSHLKRGSVRVRRGERVETGQTLGLIGLSGNTEFPHVEFSVRLNGTPVDPFVGPAPGFACGGERRPLWSAAALRQLPYRESVPLVSGFAAERPEAEAARRGRYAAESLPADTPILFFWADVSGTFAGDVQRIRIEGPDGQSFGSNQSTLEKSNILRFSFFGARRPPTGWPPGEYRGTYELVRKGAPAVTMSDTVRIGD